MIIVMEHEVGADKVEEIKEEVLKEGLTPEVIVGATITLVAVRGDLTGRDIETLRGHFQRLEGVAEVQRISHLYGPKVAKKPYRKGVVANGGVTQVRVGDVVFGGGEPVVIAGPCAVRSLEHTIETAMAVKEAGANALRGGAYKPRTHPGAFQGLGVAGLTMLARAREATGLPVITELMHEDDLPAVVEFADMIQIGTRNAQNFGLLKRVGKINKPVLLKRGLGNTIEEWLGAAGYIVEGGNTDVVLCARGIVTFSKEMRNMPDVNAIPIIHQESCLPIVFDPSHSTGSWRYVASMSFAAVAAGADGLLIDVDPDPLNAPVDAEQALKPEDFAALVRRVRRISEARIESVG